MLQQDNMSELFRGPQELVGDDGHYDYIITNSIYVCSLLFTFLFRAITFAMLAKTDVVRGLIVHVIALHYQKVQKMLFI